MTKLFRQETLSKLPRHIIFNLSVNRTRERKKGYEMIDKDAAYKPGLIFDRVEGGLELKDKKELNEQTELEISEKEFVWAREVLWSFDDRMKFNGTSYVAEVEYDGTKIKVEADRKERHEDRVERTIYVTNSRYEKNQQDLRFQICLNSSEYTRGGTGGGSVARKSFFMNVNGNPNRLYSGQQIKAIAMTSKVLTLPMETALGFIASAAAFLDVKGCGFHHSTIEKAEKGHFTLNSADMDWYTPNFGELRSFVYALITFMLESSINVGKTVDEYNPSKYTVAMEQAMGLKKGSYEFQIDREEPDEEGRRKITGVRLHRKTGASREVSLTMYSKDEEQLKKGKGSSVVVAQEKKGEIRMATKIYKTGLNRIMGNSARKSIQVIDLYEWAKSRGGEESIRLVEEYIMEVFGLEYFILADWHLPGDPVWETYYKKAGPSVRAILDEWHKGTPWLSDKMSAVIPGGFKNKAAYQKKILTALKLDLAYSFEIHEVVESSRELMKSSPKLREMARRIPKDRKHSSYAKLKEEYEQELDRNSEAFEKKRKELRVKWKEKKSSPTRFDTNNVLEVASSRPMIDIMFDPIRHYIHSLAE